MPMALIALAVTSTSAVSSFGVANDRFVINGTSPISLRSGSVHYSRIHPALWEDRLKRVRAMGLNAITTYVPWNFHEPEPGAFDFTSAWRDLSTFLRLAQKTGLLVVLRAGPYMCGEWEFGGLPSWLLANGTIKLRTYSQPYISHVERYWQRLLGPVVKPLMFANGGPVVMVQVENEFGSYGDTSKEPADKRYIEHLVDLARAALGPSALLFTTDGGNAGYMSRGSLSGGTVLTVGDGCTNPASTWAAQKQFNPPGHSPFLCSELYPGWLTHWGEKMANTSTSAAAKHLDAVLSAAGGSGSVSLYMAHGGTSFGWSAGANGNGGSSYKPDITSYDYDAPLSEGGEHGYGSDGLDKFTALAAVLRKHTPAAEPPAPAETPLRPRAALGAVPLTMHAPLLQSAAKMVPTPAARDRSVPPSGIEELGCYGGGFALIEAQLTEAISAPAALLLPSVQDRALVFTRGRHFTDPVYRGAIYRTDTAGEGALPALPTGETIVILLELLGRINFAHGMDDARFGLLGGAKLSGGATLSATWTTRCLPMAEAQLQALPWAQLGARREGPSFYRGHFGSSSSGGVDTYVHLPGFVKGSVWVNGFNLGRYWNTLGPQLTLYVPGPLLTAGARSNEIIVLELHNASANATVEFVDRPIWRKAVASPAPAPVKISKTKLKPPLYPAGAAPIIGILALPVDHGDCVTLRGAAPSKGTSCFHSLYVKWLEAAGARVAPIPFDLPPKNLTELLGSLNGALITGGETDIKSLDSPYMRAAGALYDHAHDLHAHGETWPLWGTCMGMQVLSILGAQDPSVLLSHAYDSEDLVLPLTLTPAAATSQLLCDKCLPAEARTTLLTRNATVNLHHDGVPPEAFGAGTTLGGAFSLLSTNVDHKGKAFASTIEASDGAPIFGAQWHPERPQFEWTPSMTFIERTNVEMSAMFAVASKLVSFARRSTRRFPTEVAEEAALIYNFRPVGTSSYQAYFFAPDGE